MFLLETSVLLEWVLDRERADDVQALLDTVDPSLIEISDLSLCFIGIICARYGRGRE